MDFKKISWNRINRNFPRVVEKKLEKLGKHREIPRRKKMGAMKMGVGLYSDIPGKFRDIAC